jgi:ParB/RepB/Spo0J family partition protein
MNIKRFSIPLEKISPNPWQIRHGLPDPNHIAELAADIQANGLLQVPLGRMVYNDAPIQVEEYPPLETDLLQLAFGHNRLAAYKLLAEKDERFQVMPMDLAYLSDEEMANYAWSENERRHDHTPLDRALAIQQRMEYFGWTQEQIAEHLRISRPVVANALRLLKLPAEIQKLLGAGELSERQAIALLPLFDLPETIRAAAEQYWNDQTKPSHIVKMAMGGASSDTIRNSVEELILRNGHDLKEAPWPLDAREPFSLRRQDLASDACKGCPQRQDLAHRSFCSNTDCYQIKAEVWKQHRLELASAASGFPILESDIDKQMVTNFSYNRSAVPTIRKTCCENLRLVYNSYYSNYDKDKYLVDLGYQDIEIVCKKRSGYCTCLKGLEVQHEQKVKEWSQENPDANYISELNKNELLESPESSPIEETPTGPTAEELKTLADQQRAEEKEAKKHLNELRTKAVGRVLRALVAGKIEAWKMIYRKLNYGNINKHEDDWNLEKVQQAVANKLVDEPWSGEKALSYIGRINEELKAAGMGMLDEPEKTLAEITDQPAEIQGEMPIF